MVFNVTEGICALTETEKAQNIIADKIILFIENLYLFENKKWNIKAIAKVQNLF
jgi:hypothetical protein